MVAAVARDLYLSLFFRSATSGANFGPKTQKVRKNGPEKMRTKEKKERDR